MASSQDFIEFVCEQIRGGYDIRYKKMFGEYMVYLNNKPVFLVCDNCVFVKKLDVLKDLMSDAQTGIPYDGSKEHYVLDIENISLVSQVSEILERITPLPKSRKKKQ